MVVFLILVAITLTVFVPLTGGAKNVALVLVLVLLLLWLLGYFGVATTPAFHTAK